MWKDKRSDKKGPWHCTLQKKVSVDDVKWDYKVNFPRNAAGGESDHAQSPDGEKVTIKFVKVSEKGIKISYEKQSINRILASERSQLEKFIHISFQGFTLNGNKKETEEYISRLLETGIFLNSKPFIFYGHSNSQLKSRACYLYNAIDGTTIMRKINELGDFSKIQSIAKRAKRIAQLFTSAEAFVNLDPRLTEDIPDVELNGHIYTDGCGNLSKSFAQELQRKRNIIFHNQRYTPSAFQIRYKGYKGMLMMNPDLDKAHIKTQFRASMKKFTNCPDNNFAILDYCKPFAYAFLNGEFVTLLSCLGIPNDIFLKKQKEYFDFLEEAHVDPRAAYKYLCYKREIDMAERVLLGEAGGEILNKIKELTHEEWIGSFKRNDANTERVRIMIPNSRILFGVCDYTGILKPGECHVRITFESSGIRTISGAYVIVSRNPCLHPGDIQKFKAVHCDALNHLVDCIVFPIVGQRDPASLMSGGDLDGDKFFVSWDQDIIPSTISEAYGYPAAYQPIRRDIKYADMIKYFAGYNNSSLGRVKNLYLDWASASPEGARCKECQQLNALFSSCVDGERIRVPQDLETPPKGAEAEKNKSTFVVNVLCEKVKEVALSIFKRDLEAVKTTPVEFLEFILSSNTCCLLSEFELFKLTARWCQANNRSIDDFVCYFNFGNFTSIQKHAVVSMLDTCYWRGMSELYLGTIFNGLLYSDLLSEKELRKYRLHTPKIRWQKFYSSFYDEGRRLQAELQRALESFEKKLLVFRVDEQLTVAVYIPRRLERFDDLEVDKEVQMFAFIPISDQSYRQSTVHGYRLLYDGEIIQIYEKHRPNTFIWFALNREFRKRAGIQPQEHNAKTEFKVSIALQKFSQSYSQTRARVQKQESHGLELYVVSNRDREGHDMLDISMNNVATLEKLKTLENTPREYNINLDEADWAYRQFCGEIIAKKRFQVLDTLGDISEFEQIFNSCAGLKQHDRLVQIVHHILTNISKPVYSVRIRNDVIPLLLKYLNTVPALAILVVQALAGEYDDQEESENGSSTSSTSWKVSMHPAFKNYDEHVTLACSLLSCMNDMKESAAKQFNRLPELMVKHGVRLRVPVCTQLIRQIIFSVRDPKLAAECIHAIFSEEFPILDASGIGAEAEKTVEDACVAYYKKFSEALAMDYFGQVEDKCPCDFWGVPIGAEEVEVSAERNAPSYARSTCSVKLADFIPNATPKVEEQNGTGTNGPRFKKPIQPDQICLDIKPTSNGLTFEAMLRIDLPSSIRKEDHLRFCATRRPTNQSKQRPAVFDAIVKSVGRGKMEFEIMQAVPEEIHNANWNVYICGSTMNLSAEFAALEKLIDKKSEATAAFGYIIGLGRDLAAQQNGHGGNECQIPANKFNASQEAAIRTAVRNPLTLIWGPPGTGKTTVVVEIILQFQHLYPGKRMLVSASTHKAVDNVMERFLKAFGGTDETTEDFIRLTTDPRKVSPALQKYTLDAFFGVNLAENDKAKRKALLKVQLAKIVFSTCSGAGVGLLRLAELQSLEDGKKKRKDEKFDIVIVDEASQITEPNALVPLVKNSKFVVMVGDHVQLRPIVSEIGKEFELDTSLFEKLHTQSEACKVMLNLQYRMHPDLARFPSNQFYDGKLLSGVRPEDRVLPAGRFPWPKAASGDNFYPCVFINCGSEESYGVSKSNKGQAILTRRVVDLLLPEYNDKEIKVLTPYANQVKCIQSALGSANHKNIEVSTIDGFQGREADVIIFSTVRANLSQNLGFLNDHRRINVAVTRARKGLIVIGHEGTIKDDKFWKELLAACKYVELASKSVPGPSSGEEAKTKTRRGREPGAQAGKPKPQPKKG